jgi:hypothetical protein
MCDGFLNKKNQGSRLNYPYNHPERKLPSARKFMKKKMVSRLVKGIKNKNFKT